MKITFSLDELNAVVQKMGASPSSWVVGSKVLSERATLLGGLEKGINIALSDVDVGPGNLLIYKDEQVILYIKDTQDSKEKLKYSPEQSRRFHVAECKTLSDMRAKGRDERYVVTRRIDGFFTVDWVDYDTSERGEIDAALKVCKNCLKEINFERYNQEGSPKKINIWEDFSIPSFLREYSTFFVKLPSRTDKNAPIDEYVTGWSKLSRTIRQERDWTCEKCRVNLKANKKLLHTHHANGVKTDNNPRNLKVLCALCHSSEHMHNHLKVTSTEKQTIIDTRIQQDTSTKVL